MNKILAAACALGILATGGVIAYVLNNRAKPLDDQSPTQAVPHELPAAKIDKRIVADSFYNPCGIAVQPETGHVFVAMTDRISRVVPGEKYEVHDEVIGFPTDTYGRGPVYEIGPLGLAFLDKDTLVVADGSQDDGLEIVRIYTVGAQPLARAREAAAMAWFSTPIPPGEDSVQGEGNFFAVAIHGATAFITSNGDDTKGWICKLDLDRKKPAPWKLIPFIKSKELTGTNAPMGATISPAGKLVVSQFGATNKNPDSLLTYYDPATGKMEKKLKTGLRDLIAIAYHPKSGKLYGLDFSWAEPDQGGLFELQVGADQVKAVKLTALDRPTALAFTPSGKLYVTVIGVAPEMGKRTGQLLVIDGL